MLTRKAILDHCTMMAQHEPAYALKSLQWYRKVLPWLNLPDTLEDNES